MAAKFQFSPELEISPAVRFPSLKGRKDPFSDQTQISDWKKS